MIRPWPWGIMLKASCSTYASNCLLYYASIMLTCVIARNLFLTQSRCLTIIVVMGLAMAASCSSNERNIAGSQLSSEPEVPDSVPEAEKESVSNYSCASVCVGLCGDSGDLVCDGRSECRETNGIFACQCSVGYEESGSGCIGELHTPVCFSCIIIRYIHFKGP